MLSTIFKFDGSALKAANSHNWIILVDECHRTQEKDLGAYLEKTLPHACFIGFTGTPIQTTDKDTYQNFSLPGEGYLDRYSIDDAVTDGATVPIRYTSRKAEWQIDEKKLDILFDNWFAHEPEEVVNKIKARGVKVDDLVKHRERIELLAYDIWAHFSSHALPQGFKAQIVAIDREAIILYKRELNKILTKSLQKQGLDRETATAWADAMSIPVYSSNQEDGKPSEDKYIDALRQDLRKYALNKNGETAAIRKFTGDDTEYEAKVLNREAPPVHFLIVCNKLLTGFDAPRESVMYLDNPLKEHNLLQAIARTNRVYDSHKEFGLIVDYIGVTKNLTSALSTYRTADIKNALVDLQVERNQLKSIHTQLTNFLKAAEISLPTSSTGVTEKKGTYQTKRTPAKTENIRALYDILIQNLGNEDKWYTFRRLASDFIKAYDALSPDPFILDYKDDLKWVAGFLPLATLTFEKRASTLRRDVSAKIREMLDEHLSITGITTLCQLHDINDSEFWQDFNTSDKDLKIAAVRKTAELRQIMQHKLDENELYYGLFSERVKEVLNQFELRQIDAAETLRKYEQIIRDMQASERAHTNTSLNQKAYGILKILEAFQNESNNLLEETALAINALYTSEQAPSGWHLKEQLRKQLRQQVRALVFKLDLNNWKDIPNKVEEYAIKHYI